MSTVEGDQRSVKRSRSSVTIVMLGEWRCQEGYYGGKKRVWVSLHRARNYTLLSPE